MAYAGPPHDHGRMPYAPTTEPAHQREKAMTPPRSPVVYRFTRTHCTRCARRVTSLVCRHFCCQFFQFFVAMVRDIGQVRAQDGTTRCFRTGKDNAMSLNNYDATHGLQLVTARHASIRRVFAEEHLARQARSPRSTGSHARLATLLGHISDGIRRHAQITNVGVIEKPAPFSDNRYETA